MKDDFEDIFSGESSEVLEKKREKISQFELEKSAQKNSKKREENKPQEPSKSAKNTLFFKRCFVFFVVVLAFLPAKWMLFGALDMLAVGRGSENIVLVEIPYGAKKREISEILHKNGVIKRQSFFKFYSMVLRSSKAIVGGTFKVPTYMDYELILSFLGSNANRLETDIVDATFPEGKNLHETAQILEKHEVCKAQEFLRVCEKSDFMKKYEFLGENAAENVIFIHEGYCSPDTYKFYKHTTPEEVAAKFLNTYDKKMMKKQKFSGENEPISARKLAEKRGISEKDLINIASLVQAEAANDDDMPNIASVIFNRLKTMENGGTSPFGDAINGQLCIDSTVWYPYRTREGLPEGHDTEAQRPYDTYQNRGLPPGPVCNPGMQAIRAALQPARTQYYFFCHGKEDGKPYYAKTMKEHSANLKKAGLV